MPDTSGTQASPPRTGDAVLYCLVPEDKPKLRALLDRHYRNFAGIRVVAERRAGDRRSRVDRRRGAGAPRGAERRRTNPEPERRGSRRRGETVLVKPPVPLPPEARRYADLIVFVERPAGVSS